jgi:hypothetical protein
MYDVCKQGGDRPAPTLGRDSGSQDEEDESGSEDEGAGRSSARYSDGDDDDDNRDDDDDGGASEGVDEEWAAVDAFAQRNSQPPAKGGGGRFSRIEEEVRSAHASAAPLACARAVAKDATKFLMRRRDVLGPACFLL